MPRTELHRGESHSPHRAVTGGTARAAVFGVSDGLVSNVSLILGFAGSDADASIVRLAGLAGAIAGGISMAAGEWISISAQNELIERELDIERREIATDPRAETAELIRMYEADGMDPDHAERAAADVMREPAEALAVHARAELGIDPAKLASPARAAASSLLCFLIGAILPVLPWLGSASGVAPAAASVVIGVLA
ncbi:MAG: VIT1/CCC1 transporter family protein, partial [Ilumatobacteraceae bacterium]